MTNAAPSPLISTKQAAERLGVAEITMRLWRWRKVPSQPPYVRVGSRGIRYSVEALDAWQLSRTHQPSTSKRAVRK